ncbi:MAG: hypothetical protein E7591_07580 [Ruminococcaceae bacterium]|nr:hypothetical protein [Oscillospiraceae bacterium]
MKKFLLVLLALALVLTMTACKDKDSKKKKKNSEKETKIEETVDGTTEAQTNGEGEVIEPNIIVEDGDDTGISGIVYTDETDEEGNYIPQETLPEQQVISDGGKESGLWPDVIPDEVPVFDSYTEMYTATYEDYEDCDFWSLTFDTTEADYLKWIEKVEAEGYIADDKIVGYYGKGDILLDIYPEDAGDIYYLSIDIYRNDPAPVPSQFPKFETDSVIYFFEEEDENTLKVLYVCGTNFDNDASNYTETLTSNGFTVAGNTATLVSGSTSYSCTIDYQNKAIVYTY